MSSKGRLGCGSLGHVSSLRNCILKPLAPTNIFTYGLGRFFLHTTIVHKPWMANHPSNTHNLFHASSSRRPKNSRFYVASNKNTKIIFKSRSLSLSLPIATSNPQFPNYIILGSSISISRRLGHWMKKAPLEQDSVYRDNFTPPKLSPAISLLKLHFKNGDDVGQIKVLLSFQGLFDVLKQMYYPSPHLQPH